MVASGIADRCCVEIAYAIGRAEPVAVQVDTFDSVESGATVARAIGRAVSLTPAAIRGTGSGSSCRSTCPPPRTATSGVAAGSRTASFVWERLNLVEDLLRNLG